MHPFVSLMRTYCIDYTNSHDLSVCDSIMEPSYTVRICGMTLERDPAYKPSVETVFERFAGLGLVVHELITNGDRLAMIFSEHGADGDGNLACWSGIGLYDWNDDKLVTCRVEQDFWSQNRQLRSGVPDPLETPHLDPWTTTVAEEPDASAEAVVADWLAAGDFAAAETGRIDEGSLAAHEVVVDVETVDVLDSFSAGNRVAFHARATGTLTGTHDIGEAGRPAHIDVAGVATVEDGAVRHVRVVTDRFGLSLATR